jgi:predicted transcriptional regulator
MAKPVAEGDMWKVYAGIAVSPMSGTDKAVLAVLVDYADVEGKAWPSESTIAARLNLNIRCVKRSIANLVRAGHVERKRRHCQSNVYSIAFATILKAWTASKANRPSRTVPGSIHECSTNAPRKQATQSDRSVTS